MKHDKFNVEWFPQDVIAAAYTQCINATGIRPEKIRISQLLAIDLGAAGFVAGAITGYEFKGGELFYERVLIKVEEDEADIWRATAFA